MSGTVVDRPALKKLLLTPNDGDSLVIWTLDRLDRNMRTWVLLSDDYTSEVFTLSVRQTASTLPARPGTSSCT
uniref:recombinase family protein n=1 Tax=Citrobacter sp. NCU1 TaxID=2026683 RepID=UPI001EE1DF8A|nr:recombinase family protein [Citrobacter sp. NCU1]